MFRAQLDNRHPGRAGVACLLDGTATPSRVVVDQYVKSQVVSTTLADGGFL